MSLFPGILWFACGSITALLVYEFMFGPRIRRRTIEAAREEWERGRGAQAEAEAQRLTARCARLEAQIRRLQAERTPAPVAGPPPEPAAEEKATPAVLLVLVRHGDAGEDPGDDGRELTQAGKRSVRMLSGYLQSLDFSPVAVRTSPQRRARQTAETIFSALADSGGAQVTSSLAPGAGVDDMFALLKVEKPNTAVCWVGHMPAIGAFASRLLGKDGEMAFRFGSAVALRVDTTVDPPMAITQWTWST